MDWRASDHGFSPPETNHQLREQRPTAAGLNSTEHSSPAAPIAQNLRRFVPAAAAVIVISVACLILLTWDAGMMLLKSVIPNHPATARTFIVAGAALWLLAGEGSGKAMPRWRGWLATFAAALVTLSGAFAVAGYLVGPHAALARPLLHSALSMRRMASNTGFAFLLIGLAFLIQALRIRSAELPAQLLASGAAVIALIVIIGHAYHSLVFASVGTQIPMMLDTACMFLVLWIGVLCLTPSQALLGIITSGETGGIMARRLLVATVVVPFVLGWLLLLGQRERLYDIQLGVAIMTASTIAVLVALVMLTARLLNRIDSHRRQAQAQVSALNAELAVANKHLENLAYHDALTGVPNRRTFDERFERELLRARRYKRDLALLLIDIDNFKRVNDVHGHPAGDRALQTVAGIIASRIRSSDWVARYGGEEFAVVLPETDADGAKRIAEQLRLAVEDKRIQAEGDKLGMTISIGIASLCEQVASVQAMIEQADQAMYAAKQGGRNQVRA
jgi:diguanylate cyclase (GGDEF)-like protein